MKSQSTLLNTVLICAVMFLAINSGFPARTASAAEGNPAPVINETSCSTGRSVSVSGTAVVNVTPDRVLIQLGVQSNGRQRHRLQGHSSNQKAECCGKGYRNRPLRDRPDL